jgi:hypothetical protein
LSKARTQRDWDWYEKYLIQQASKPGGAVLSGGALQSDLAQLKANEAILTRRF